MPEEARSKTLEAVKNPLGFFALALLIIEGLIAILSVSSSSQLAMLALLAAGMFVFVIIVMAVLVAKFAPELLARSPSELQRIPTLLGEMFNVIQLTTAKKALEAAFSPAAVVEAQPGQPAVMPTAPPPPKKG